MSPTPKRINTYRETPRVRILARAFFMVSRVTANGDVLYRYATHTSLTPEPERLHSSTELQRVPYLPSGVSNLGVAWRGAWCGVRQCAY